MSQFDADADRRRLWADTFKTVLQKTLEPNCDVVVATDRAITAADRALKKYTDEFFVPTDQDTDPEEGDDHE